MRFAHRKEIPQVVYESDCSCGTCIKLRNHVENCKINNCNECVSAIAELEYYAAYDE